jgi:hypothetical protein
MNKQLLRAAALGTAPAAAVLLAVSAPALPASASSVRSDAAHLKCHASMTNSHPADYTEDGVKVRTVAFARIKTVAHYKTVNHVKHRTANAAGRRTVWYYISGATPGYRVVVDVYVSHGGRAGSCSTSFTPHR